MGPSSRDSERLAAAAVGGPTAAVARRLEEGGPAEAEREARWRLSEGRKLVQQLGEMLGIASTGH